MKKITQSQVTRQDIMRRAHELAKLNNGSSAHKRPFGEWLKLAWAEAREGRTQNWLWLCPENELAALEDAYESARVHSFGRGGPSRAEVNGLFHQITELRAKIARTQIAA
jgi:hypothetical protein